ncbi:hypothetical protein F3J44_18465 [Pantoea sp. Tr-811]|uniref:hypothetical protein n=1 Tax=Pantoea sp. Tr-811 TaxID=2608361 RepID=UPI0014245C73|nr:hypothetical protein [Pantoea sp. Tr-811]NIF28355.1 hypothetical protein [Pantoea sp. Tr-811]
MALIFFANLFLWLFLFEDPRSDSGGERAIVFDYFVMYVWYFSFFVAAFCIGSASVRVLMSGWAKAKCVSLILDLPIMLYSLVVGLLSAAIALNGSILMLMPAFIYLIVLILVVFPGAFVGLWNAVKGH